MERQKNGGLRVFRDAGHRLRKQQDRKSDSCGQNVKYVDSGFQRHAGQMRASPQVRQWRLKGAEAKVR